MLYANLAVRGRTMDEILAEQIQTAVMLEPDIVTIYAGMNDLLVVRNDIDAMMARYADALKTLQQSGAVVLTFTAADLGTVPLFRRLRGRAAIYNELLRTIVDDLGVQLVDFWRFSEFRDPRLWDGDRIHLSPLGHERMAAKVLDTLTVPHNLTTRSAALLASAPPARSFWGNLRWTMAFAAPWVARAAAAGDTGGRCRAEVDDVVEGALAWRRCLAISASTTPAATEAFSDSVGPAIGMDTTASQFSRTRRDNPFPSEPTTTTTGPVPSSSSIAVSPSASSPTI